MNSSKKEIIGGFYLDKDIIINDADHRYMNKGIDLANEIIDWAEKIKSK
ncbi:TPA: hypothetical protein ACJFE8_001689 [Clostridium sporogenes]|nr:hypothetical protein [Clostridium botulinum]